MNTQGQAGETGSRTLMIMLRGRVYKVKDIVDVCI